MQAGFFIHLAYLNHLAKLYSYKMLEGGESKEC